MKRLPKLPTVLHSILGPVSVGTLDAKLAATRELYGHFIPDTRRIEVSLGMERNIEWVTFWHEAVHVALTDSGANNQLTEPQAEMVCDALGAFLTRMMRTGQLAVRSVPQASSLVP